MALIVQKYGGTSVGDMERIRNVAQVNYGSEIRQGAVTMTNRDLKGQPQPLGEVVTGIVLKRIGANTKMTIDGIKERLPIVQKALPKGVQIETIYDQADLIQQAVRTVVKALIEAFVLIVLVLFLFLMNIRATLLVLISVRTSSPSHNLDTQGHLFLYSPTKKEVPYHYFHRK